MLVHAHKTGMSYVPFCPQFFAADALESLRKPLVLANAASRYEASILCRLMDSPAYQHPTIWRPDYEINGDQRGEPDYMFEVIRFEPFSGLWFSKHTVLPIIRTPEDEAINQGLCWFVTTLRIWVGVVF